MSNATIDQNDKPTLIAYNDIAQEVDTIKVDPVFGGLEIFIAGTSSGTYTAINNAKIDANENSTLTAYNETTGLIECCRCDDNGNLLVYLTS